jgi:NAD(P)-dependent dehydrogenase (short-subunit alcohol dehydrogenase family)
MEELGGRIAVVTGGASGIGKAICRALLDEGVTVVIADVEERAIDASVDELTPHGKVSGMRTDVSDPESVLALADHIFATFGACHLLFNNAGVGVPGSGGAWQGTPNDWRWVLGVNVHGVVNGVRAFVPRMISSGEEGVVVNTTSGNGGFAPMPNAALYAASKAAMTAYTECLARELIDTGTKLRAALFYPSGGLLQTGLFTSERNRPAELAREIPVVGGDAFEAYRKSAEAAGRQLHLQDLDELAQLVVEGVKDGRYIIGFGVEAMAKQLEVRAEAIGRCELPPDIFATTT